jgi:hypothetical protein
MSTLQNVSALGAAKGRAYTSSVTTNLFAIAGYAFDSFGRPIINNSLPKKFKVTAVGSGAGSVVAVAGGGAGGAAVTWITPREFLSSYTRELDYMSISVTITIGPGGTAYNRGSNTSIVVQSAGLKLTMVGEGGYTGALRGGTSQAWWGGAGGYATITRETIGTSINLSTMNGYSASTPSDPFASINLYLKGGPGEGYGRYLYGPTGGNSIFGGGGSGHSGAEVGIGAGAGSNGEYAGGQGIVIFEW